MAYRILVAGFQHETNTFAPSKAEYENFVRGEGFPQMVRGADVLKLREVNIPAGGFLIEAERLGYEVVPVIWAGASPSAHVTQAAYERIANEIIQAAASQTLDGLYLDLHGAMVAEHTNDGEGTLLSRLRAVVGPDIPIVVSLDLHANVTDLMLEQADAMVAFRTYPHVDMAETGIKAAQLLDLRLRCGKLQHASLRLPFLIPVNGMCTLLEPARSLDKLVGEEDQWEVPLLLPDDAVRQAMALAASAQRPIVIADTQDNPGAGGDGNTMGMLKALLSHQARNAAIGLIYDPAAVQAAIAAGLGGFIDIALGGQSGVPGDEPLQGRFEVTHLSDGRCRFEGPMMNGMDVDVGPVAGLKIDDVSIAVSSSKCQMLDRTLYRLAGIDPEKMSVLVNKSSVHFRADFQPIAEHILVAKAPGPMTADPADIPWTRLREGIRLKPNGPAFHH